MMEYRIETLRGYTTESDTAALNMLAANRWVVISTYVLNEEVHVVLSRHKQSFSDYRGG